MSIRKQLESVVEGMPDDASVTLTVAWLRALLQEEADRAGEAPDGVLTLAEVGERVGRAEGTVRTWCNSGKLEGAFRLNGRDWRVPESSLRKYLDAQADQRPNEVVSPGNVDLGSWRKHRKGAA